MSCSDYLIRTYYQDLLTPAQISAREPVPEKVILLCKKEVEDEKRKQAEQDKKDGECADDIIDAQTIRDFGEEEAWGYFNAAKSNCLKMKKEREQQEAIDATEERQNKRNNWNGGKKSKKRSKRKSKKTKRKSRKSKRRTYKR
jgi:hypothetical protein